MQVLLENRQFLAFLMMGVASIIAGMQNHINITTRSLSY